MSWTDFRSAADEKQTIRAIQAEFSYTLKIMQVQEPRPIDMRKCVEGLKDRLSIRYGIDKDLIGGRADVGEE